MCEVHMWSAYSVKDHEGTDSVKMLEPCHQLSVIISVVAVLAELGPENLQACP
jgi:hypothetical protein